MGLSLRFQLGYLLTRPFLFVVFVARFLAVALCDLALTVCANFVCFAARARLTVTVLSVRFALTILERCAVLLTVAFERFLSNVDLYDRSMPTDLSTLVFA